MQIRVAFWWTVREGPSRVPGGERALCIDSESCLSKGSAMLTCPTIPSSKNVHGRTYPHQRPSAQFFPPPPQLTPPTHPPRPIHHPPHNQKIPRPHLLPQTPHSTEPHRGPAPQFLQRRHVRAEGDLVRGVGVVRAVAGEEGYDCWFGRDWWFAGRGGGVG